MFNTLFESTSLPVLEQVVNFAQERHNVLAGNIANLDTPGYKVRDLSVDVFQQRLRDALEARHGIGEPVSPGRIVSQDGDPLRQVGESLETILFHDESNVGMEQQVTELAKNQFMHNMAIAIMASQFQLLQVAISERV